MCARCSQPTGAGRAGARGCQPGSLFPYQSCCHPQSVLRGRCCSGGSLSSLSSLALGPLTKHGGASVDICEFVTALALPTQGGRECYSIDGDTGTCPGAWEWWAGAATWERRGQWAAYLRKLAQRVLQHLHGEDEGPLRQDLAVSISQVLPVGTRGGQEHQSHTAWPDGGPHPAPTQEHLPVPQRPTCPLPGVHSPEACPKPLPSTPSTGCPGPFGPAMCPGTGWAGLGSVKAGGLWLLSPKPVSRLPAPQPLAQHR